MTVWKDLHGALDPQQYFTKITEPHRRPLMAHCYRMLGSVEDAEDLVQETLFKAWRARDSYSGRASFRTWLFKIATNACLDALDKRSRRALPATALAPSSPDEPHIEAVDETPWLTPYPDDLVAEITSGPEAVYTQLESIRLAFLVMLHRLPPRQRAVLLLRDVLGWRAREVADQLDMTVAAANSALRRARATLHEHYDASPSWNDANEESEEIVKLYMQAWESADVAGLVQLLKEGVTFSMPPSPTWYHGRAAVRTFLTRVLFAGDTGWRWRLRPVRANGQPGLALYERAKDDNVYRASALQILTVENREIADVTSFVTPSRFVRSNLKSAGQWIRDSRRSRS